MASQLSELLHPPQCFHRYKPAMYTCTQGQDCTHSKERPAHARSIQTTVHTDLTQDSHQPGPPLSYRFSVCTDLLLRQVTHCQPAPPDVKEFILDLGSRPSSVQNLQTSSTPQGALPEGVPPKENQFPKPRSYTLLQVKTTATEHWETVQEIEQACMGNLLVWA